MNEKGRIFNEEKGNNKQRDWEKGPKIAAQTFTNLYHILDLKGFWSFLSMISLAGTWIIGLLQICCAFLFLIVAPSCFFPHHRFWAVWHKSCLLFIHIYIGMRWERCNRFHSRFFFFLYKGEDSIINDSFFKHSFRFNQIKSKHSFRFNRSHSIN